MTARRKGQKAQKHDPYRLTAQERIRARFEIIKQNLQNIVSVVNDAISRGADVSGACVLVIDTRDPIAKQVMPEHGLAEEPVGGAPPGAFRTAIFMTSREVVLEIIATYRSSGAVGGGRYCDDLDSMPIVCVSHGGVSVIEEKHDALTKPVSEAVAALQQTLVDRMTAWTTQRIREFYLEQIADLGYYLDSLLDRVPSGTDMRSMALMVLDHDDVVGGHLRKLLRDAFPGPSRSNVSFILGPRREVEDTIRRIYGTFPGWPPVDMPVVVIACGGVSIFDTACV